LFLFVESIQLFVMELVLVISMVLAQMVDLMFIIHCTDCPFNRLSLPEAS